MAKFEKNGAAAKVIKHMERFKQLLKYQLKNNSISKELYELLNTDADSLIQKWQGK
ncbi:hypothetical protein J14TS2_23000 [Bacillus sp. J14TS2]|uniref:FIMAH domain-containing protein n=1 Tax=Bacillus sp. J14TS2 TaxID=2807188 RepID=UPI001B26B9A0|nr:hypothetical protein J14TS2_23000 [Bacillus sp. J14TS2]